MSKQRQAIAVLEWYQAMGVDEWVEETPQNRFNKAEPKTETPKEARKTVEAAPLTPTPKAPTSSNYTPPAAALQNAKEIADKCSSLDELRDAVMNFKELGICRSATQPVFAEGVSDSPLMVIGEAPGAEEDRKGVPFCGPSGQLLDKMLAAIDMSRSENVYITNTVFWRPPGNRTPSAEEIAICQPFVRKHIQLQKPKLVLLLGGVAVRSVLDESNSISRLRGKNHDIPDSSIQAAVSYHPSYLLRQPSQKRLAWQDLLRIKAALA